MVHALFRAARSRHPFARLAMGVLGILVVALFITVGVFALAALVIGGAVLLLINTLRSTPRSHSPASESPAAAPDVIEGEFKVVSATPAQRDPQAASR